MSMRASVLIRPAHAKRNSRFDFPANSAPKPKDGTLLSIAPTLPPRQDLKDFLDQSLYKRKYISFRDCLLRYPDNKDECSSTYNLYRDELKALPDLSGHRAIVYGVACTRDNLFASGSDDNSLRLW